MNRERYHAEDVLYEINKKAYEKIKKAAIDGAATQPPASKDPMLSTVPRAPEKPRLKQIIVQDATVAAMREVLLGNTGGVFNFQNEMVGFIAAMDMFHNGKGADQSFWVATDDGKPLTVNYRVWLQEGLMKPEDVAALSQNFVEPVQVTVRAR